MRDPFSDSPEFQRLLRGDEAVDLVLINLEMARDADPDLDAGRLPGGRSTRWPSGSASTARAMPAPRA